jgi:hypothetical protein
MGPAVEYLIEAPFYKPEGTGFVFQWVIVFVFYLPNPSCRTTTLVLTQRLIEMSTHNLTILRGLL